MARTPRKLVESHVGESQHTKQEKDNHNHTRNKRRAANAALGNGAELAPAFGAVTHEKSGGARVPL